VADRQVADLHETVTVGSNKKGSSRKKVGKSMGAMSV
jgi:hypothetical protein